jgi:sugar phosphate isomerase/epimerase
MQLQRCNRAVIEASVRLALVTEGMIHRSLDELMDWLDENTPDIRLLEVGTGGYSPLGHSPLSLGAPERHAWYDRIRRRGFDVGAFNVSGNPLHPAALVARRHDADLRRTIELAAELGIDRIVAMSGCPGADSGASEVPHFAANAWLPDYVGVATRQWQNAVRPYWEDINELVDRIAPDLLICLELHPGAHVFNVDTFLGLNAAAPRIGVNLDPSHLFWQRMEPLAVVARLGRHIGHAHAKDVRYNSSELALNGLLDNRWPGDPRTIPWDFAAVGLGDHGETWWNAFASALERDTQALMLSIEHEDRLHSAEDGVSASASMLATPAVELAT